MYHERESLSIGGAGGHFRLSKPGFSRESMIKRLLESFYYEASFPAQGVLERSPE
jgi:hypothetical protein